MAAQPSGPRVRRTAANSSQPANRVRARNAIVHYRRSDGESEISCCVKYTVFGFNVLFWIIGVGLLAIGTWAQVEKNPYSQLSNQISKFYLDPAWLLVIVGGVTFIIGFSGCIGALRENTCLLAFYSTLLGVLLLTELAVAILGFVSKDWVQREIETSMNEMIKRYRDDEDLQLLIDWMQRDWLLCCGINDPDDWDMNIYFNKSSLAQFNSPEAGGVPYSCCKAEVLGAARELENYNCGNGVRLKEYKGTTIIHDSGCLPKLVTWLNNNVLYVGIALVVVAVIQILGICFAQNLRSDIFAQRAKWYYQR